MVSRAPPDVRAAIEGIVLLNPGRTVDFQFHISNWLGGGNAAPYALEPELSKLGAVPLLCLYASEDAAEALCPALAGRQGTVVQELPGDHHFDGDYAGLTRLILQRFPAAR
jgi:type IV secretory pathway VirJ component